MAADIIPLAKSRGLYDAGVFPNGSTVRDGLDLKLVEWAGRNYRAFFDRIPDPSNPEPVWLGSLMSHKRDASGQLYMHNRYLDPTSGRFTQEDPIGMAGGLNLYGFGGGDPVTYSDPYGLCRRPKGNGVGICIETFIATKWVLGAPVGDNRGARGNGGSFRTHVSFSVDPSTGAISGLESANGRTLGVPGRGQAWVGRAESDGNGGWNVAVVGYGKTNAAPLPYINYAFGMNVAADGTVTMDGGGHDGFPSYEVWAYSEDGQATNVYHHKEGWVGELAGVADIKVGERQK